MRLVSLSILANCTLFAGCITLKPSLTPQPADPIPDPPRSEVTVPISASLMAIRNAAEQALPAHLGVAPFNLSGCNPDPAKGCGPDYPACSWNAGYDLDRGPLGLSGGGQQFTARTQLAYSVRGRVRLPCPGPLFSGSCGIGEPPRRAEARVDATITLRDDWGTQIAASVPPVNPLDNCQVGPFGVIDITPRISEGMTNALRQVANGFDQQVSSIVRAREHVEKAWQFAQAPVDLGNGNAWLVVAPDALQATQPSISGDQVQLRIGVRATPRIVIGAKPDVTPSTLPNRSDPGPNNSFMVNLPADISFAELRAQLRRALQIEQGGRRFPANGKAHMQVIGADLEGTGKAIRVTLDVKGTTGGLIGRKIKGKVVLVGTPMLDEKCGVVSMPDLDFTVDTKNLLVRFADWLKH